MTGPSHLALSELFAGYAGGVTPLTHDLFNLAATAWCGDRDPDVSQDNLERLLRVREELRALPALDWQSRRYRSYFLSYVGEQIAFVRAELTRREM